MPRPVADYLAMWRDLPWAPRQVLLNRSHLRGSSLAVLAGMAADLLIAHPAAEVVAYVLLVVLGPSSLVAVAGSVAHLLWDRERIWADLDCQFCGDGPDDGGGGGWESDGPDGGGLVREITDYLHDHHARTSVHA
ncbi:hypothetical protein [Streptomyces ziwulingensis]|uniref:hypothetical protein n=1 Tax=Streptomyces ziwulingensis TaxID=1045501 RepID=UPI0031F1290C